LHSRSCFLAAGSGSKKKKGEREGTRAHTQLELWSGRGQAGWASRDECTAGRLLQLWRGASYENRRRQNRRTTADGNTV